MKTLIDSFIRNIYYPTAIAAITTVNPELGMLCNIVFGASAMIDEWRMRRVGEIYGYLGNEGVRFFVNGSDNDKDIAHKIFQSLMDEAAKEKRKLFYNYLNNYKNGYKVNLDYHSKLTITLNLMTLEEINGFKNFYNNYPKIIQYYKLHRDASEDKRPLFKNSKTFLKYIYGSKIFKNQSQDWVEDFTEKLGNYGLIHVRTGRYGGTMYGPTTEFGKILLKYIDNQ
jgi:hypothetical protein